MTMLLRRLTMAFAEPAFRWLWGASTAAFVSMIAGGLALGWLVLELTDSAFWVGAAAAFRGIGQLLFGIFAGALLDRLEKRAVLAVIQGLDGLLLFGLGLLILGEQAQLWHFLAGALLQGILTSVRAPAFNTLVYQMVGAGRVLNANAAMGLGFNLAMVVGSSLAGGLIERFGGSAGFFFAAAAALTGALALLLVQGSFRVKRNREPLVRAALAGVGYAYRDEVLRKLLLLSIVLEMFGFSYHILLPVVARDVLGVGAAGLGVLSSARGVGAALSNLGVASLGDVERKSRLLSGAVVGVGVFLVLFGFSPWFSLSVALIFALGMMLTVYDVTMKSVILLSSEDDWRERVQSIYTLTYGFGALSGFLSGWLAALAGASYALAAGGVFILAYIGGNWRALAQAEQRAGPPAARLSGPLLAVNREDADQDQE